MSTTAKPPPFFTAAQLACVVYQTGPRAFIYAENGVPIGATSIKEEALAWQRNARAALAAQTPAQRQAAYLHKLHQDLWVNFKLFGLLGLTLAFVLAQGVYIGRYLPPASAAESAA